MKITTQHAKCQRIAAAKHMIKRLLFDRVHIKPSHISPGYPQFPLLVESHLTNTASSGADHTAMPACIAAYCIIGQGFVQLALSGHRIKIFFNCGHHRFNFTTPSIVKRRTLKKPSILGFRDSPQTLKVFSPFQDTLFRGIVANNNDDSQWKPLGSSSVLNVNSLIYLNG